MCKKKKLKRSSRIVVFGCVGIDLLGAGYEDNGFVFVVDVILVGVSLFHVGVFFHGCDGYS